VEKIKAYLAGHVSVASAVEVVSSPGEELLLLNGALCAATELELRP
jgi:hypothetical protein